MNSIAFKLIYMLINLRGIYFEEFQDCGINKSVDNQPPSPITFSTINNENYL